MFTLVLPLSCKSSSSRRRKNYIFSLQKSKCKLASQLGVQIPKFDQKFEKRTPQQCINLLKDLEKIWMQNSLM
jgi:hypothetical protein